MEKKEQRTIDNERTNKGLNLNHANLPMNAQAEFEKSSSHLSQGERD